MGNDGGGSLTGSNLETYRAATSKYNRFDPIISYGFVPERRLRPQRDLFFRSCGCRRPNTLVHQLLIYLETSELQ